MNSSWWRQEGDTVDEQSHVEAGGGRRWMNSSPWRLEEVDGGDEPYPVESCFAVRHTPPVEQDPCFDRSAPTQVRFLRFAVRHTPPDQQDPIPNVGGPFPPSWGTPGLVSIACSVPALPMNTTTHSVPTQPVGSHAFRCLPMNTAHSVASR